MSLPFLQRHLAPFLPALAALLLGACTTLPAPSTLNSEHARDAHTLQSWRAEGKIGLRFQDKGGSLYFTWRQDKEHFTLDMAGPLGQGQTRMEGNGQRVRMENASTGQVEAGSPEAVMQQVLGWQAPVSHLRYWLRGLPATPEATVSRSANGDVSQITEDGWQADIQRYAEAKGYHLPSRLVITGPDTRLTLLVSDWQPAP